MVSPPGKGPIPPIPKSQVECVFSSRLQIRSFNNAATHFQNNLCMHYIYTDFTIQLVFVEKVMKIYIFCFKMLKFLYTTETVAALLNDLI